MNELTLKLDCWVDEELKDYLLNLPGVQTVTIDDSLTLLIDIHYNQNITSAKILKMEVFTFLKIDNLPSLIYFDKHSNNKLTEYDLVIESLCCEYCLKSDIADLLMMDGIEKAVSNIDEVPYRTNSKAIINIFYDDKRISKEELKKITEKLNK